MSPAVILALIFSALGIAITGPILGEALQERRRKGQARLEFPGRNLFAWPEYLARDRYEREGRRYIVWLVITQFILPVGLLILWMSVW